jgi:PAS domain S-box-containing protein
VRQGDPAACEALLRRLLPKYPEYANFGVITPAGDVTCSAVPRSGSVSVADRPHVRRVMETRDLVAGEFQIGRITGKTVLPFLYPVLDPVGDVRAVVFAALHVERLAASGREAPLPEGSALLVLAGDGRLLARDPDPTRWVGQVIGDVPLVRTILAQREGTTRGPDLDGVARLYAVASAKGAAGTGDIVVGVGFPMSDILRASNRALTRNLLSLLVAGALALAAAWVGSGLVMRRGRQLMTAVGRLETGDFTARTGVPHGHDEIGRLAHALDGMADALARRTAERKRLAAVVEESEERLRLAAQASGTGLWDWDLRTNAVYFSPEWKAQLGYREDELPSRFEEWESRLHPDDRERTLATVRAYLAEPWENYETEFRLRYRDGSYRWILTRASLVRGPDGTPVRMLGSHIDITERKRAEALARAVAEVARDLATSLVPEEVVGRMVATVRRLFDAVSAALFELDAAAATLRCAAIDGVDDRAGAAGTTIPSDQAVVGLALAGGQPVLSADVLADPRVTLPPAVREQFLAQGTHAVMAVPLVARGERLGALGVAARAGQAFTEGDLEALAGFAGQAALALQNARLFAEARAALDAAREASLRVTTTLERVTDGFVALDAD